MTQPFVDDQLEPGEDEEAQGGEGQNRAFILVAIGLGGLFVVGLICIGLYAFVVAPQQRGQRETAVANINANNTQVAIDAANTANPPTATSLPTEIPLDTPIPLALITDTPVIGIASSTPTITNTPGPSPTPSRTPTRVGGTPGIGGGAGPGTGTATRTIGTVTATFTRGPGTGTPIGGFGGGEGLTPTPTGLPNTGFADEVAAPGLFIAAIILVAVLVLARRLRLQNG